MQYSVIIPIYNEAENIASLVDELDWVMHCYEGRWELIFVDDHSNDKTEQVLARIVKKKPYVHVVRLKKNYGQTNAFACGIKHAKGRYIISLDGDGQNDPRDIPLLIETSHKGPTRYDLVSGSRQNRQDPWHKRLIGACANSIRRALLHDKTEDTGCSLKIYRKEALDKIALFDGMHRFLPALFQMHGFSTCEVPVHHRKRKRGKSKYSLFNRFSSLTDLFAVRWMQKRCLSYEIESKKPETND